MVTHPIVLADGLALPIEAVAKKFAFMGISGSGKTYGAGRLVEQLLEHGAQTVIVDGVGIWWGLRLAADGKGDGFANVYIFGGDRDDIPLEPTAGALIADVIVDSRISVVLDVSEFTGAEQRRFVTDFAVQLFQ